MEESSQTQVVSNIPLLKPGDVLLVREIHYEGSGLTEAKMYVVKMPVEASSEVFLQGIDDSGLLEPDIDCKDLSKHTHVRLGVYKKPNWFQRKFCTNLTPYKMTDSVA